MTNYRITGLAPDQFIHLFGLDERALSEAGARRVVVTETPGVPDRIEMRDLEPGETALLLNYEHQPAATPYRSTHAIFIREGATRAYDRTNEIPEVMLRRQLSLRAFDARDMMIDADVVEGHDAEALIHRLFSNDDVAYIHVHNAKRGCYSARIDRALHPCHPERSSQKRAQSKDRNDRLSSAVIPSEAREARKASDVEGSQRKRYTPARKCTTSSGRNRFPLSSRAS